MRRTSIGILVGITVFIYSVNTFAQSPEKKIEASAQFTTFMDPISGALSGEGLGHKAEPGFGGRFGYNVNRNFAVEAEINFFPRDPETGILGGGHMTQGLFGVKLGKRFSKLGLFGKFRPGFISYGRSQRDFFTPMIKPERVTHVAFDVGGVVEFYPSSQTFVRFDLGDTFVRYRRVENVIFDASGPFSTASVTRHNLQLSVGFGFRF